MREIKFRAWEEDTHYMNDNVRITRTMGETFYEVSEAFGWIEVKPEHVMQHTGRKDSEGNEIYEGDILQSEHYFKYQVIFKGDCWRCEPVKNNRLKNRFIGSDLKVIGNIYENPELLDRQQ